MGFGKMNKLSPGSNMRWESSRMMLPEHVEALRLHKRVGMKKQRPEFDDKIVVGIVTRVDARYKRVRVEYEEDYDWIPVGDIIAIL